MTNELIVVWEDEDGVRTTTSMSVSTDDPTSALISNLIQALRDTSEAGIVKYGIVRNHILDPATAAAGGPYDIGDKLILEATTTAGQIAKISVPAPIAPLFDDSDQVSSGDLPGGATENAALKALWDELVLYYERDGQTLVTPIRGYRTRTHRADP